MAKARVYELAKELGVGNKEILEQLKKKNVEVKNHMSTVEDNVAEEIRRENAGRNEEPAKAEPAAEKAGEKDSTVPKKKNLAFVVRPQNSRNSSRLQGNKRPGANQGRGAAQGNARGGENRPVRAAGAEGRPVRTERAAQAGTRQEVPAEREDRYVRREMTDHSVQAVTERTVRFVTAVMQEADVRMETEEVSVRKEDRVTTVMQEADANRGSEAAITVMEEMVRDLVLTEKMITAEMTVRTETQLQSSSSRRAREIRRKIKREIIRRKNTETRHLRARAKKAKSRKMWSK